jgi:hypothetical protein
MGKAAAAGVLAVVLAVQSGVRQIAAPPAAKCRTPRSRPGRLSLNNSGLVVKSPQGLALLVFQGFAAPSPAARKLCSYRKSGGAAKRRTLGTPSCHGLIGISSLRIG